jgi:hypothetical protein
MFKPQKNEGIMKLAGFLFFVASRAGPATAEGGRAPKENKKVS